MPSRSNFETDVRVSAFAGSEVSRLCSNPTGPSNKNSTLPKSEFVMVPRITEESMMNI